MTPGQKLKRFRILVGATQKELDAVVGAKPGRTQSYEKKNAVVQLQRDYVAVLLEKFRSKVPTLSVDWFFNGVDDLPPGFETAPVATSGVFAYPTIQELPGRPAALAGSYAPAESSTRYPEGTYWSIVGDNERAPILKRGDYVLTVPESTLQPDTLYLAAGDVVDVYEARREAGVLSLRPLFDGQPAPGEPIGKAVEVRRTIGGGVILFRSETGLSVEMLGAI